MSNSNNPFYSIADSAIATNSTGDVSFTVQNFNYTSSDGTTKVSASSASMQITMNPAAPNMTRVDLNIQLSEVSIDSSSFTGKIGSADLSGYVLVNPATNQTCSFACWNNIYRCNHTSDVGILVSLLKRGCSHQ